MPPKWTLFECRFSSPTFTREIKYLKKQKPMCTTTMSILMCLPLVCLPWSVFYIKLKLDFDWQYFTMVLNGTYLTNTDLSTLLTQRTGYSTVAWWVMFTILHSLRFERNMFKTLRKPTQNVINRKFNGLDVEHGIY